MDVSHHGGSAYYDTSTMDGVKPHNGVTKHSPNGLDSEVKDAHLTIFRTFHSLGGLSILALSEACK